MASPLYDELAIAAVEMITEFGQPVTVTRQDTGAGGGVYDPETGTVTDTADTPHSSIGIHVNYSERDIDGTNILYGDQRVLIKPDLPIIPRRGDKIAFEDGTILFVEKSMPLSPAGVIVLHEVQARGTLI